MSAFQTAAAVDRCVEGEKKTSCIPVKAERIIYNCAPGFILTFTESGYVCWREDTFSETYGNFNGSVPSSTYLDLKNNPSSFPCQPLNVPQDPETGKCRTDLKGVSGASNYYEQVNAYRVGSGSIYNADDAEQMSRLCAYGTNCITGWNAQIQCRSLMSNCKVCDGTLVCSECDENYVLQDGECVWDASNFTSDDSGSGNDGGDDDAGTEADTNTISGKCPPGTTKSADGCCCMPN